MFVALFHIQFFFLKYFLSLGILTCSRHNVNYTLLFKLLPPHVIELWDRKHIKPGELWSDIECLLVVTLSRLFHRFFKCFICHILCHHSMLDCSHYSRPLWPTAQLNLISQNIHPAREMRTGSLDMHLSLCSATNATGSGKDSVFCIDMI